MDLEVIEVGEAGLPRLVRVVNDVRPSERGTVGGFLDWRRQAAETTWLLARSGNEDVGCGIGVHGWHSPPEVARTLAFVPSALRGRGIGTALVAGLDLWAARHGARRVEGTVEEDDPRSAAWLTSRGYVEVGRNSTLLLDLTRLDAPDVEPPRGIEIVTWAERPELAEAMYAVALQASADIPGEEDAESASFEAWLENDMKGAGDLPEATFVALAGGDVVGFAKLSLSPDDRERAFHDLTGVLRDWRGRGIAGALKRAEIAWAKQAGYTHLETWNEVRNTPIRILNERHGYVKQPGRITVRRELAVPLSGEL